MKKYLVIAVICIMGLLTGVLAAQIVTQNNYVAPQKASIPSTFGLIIKFDGVVWINGTDIPTWGNVTPGQSITKTVSLENTGTTTINSVTISSNNLPVGWTETLSALPNSGLAPKAVANSGVLTLTPSVNAVAGNYSWTSLILTT
jgi:uncharacterized repeat protein (TIGR01451 family)